MHRTIRALAVLACAATGVASTQATAQATQTAEGAQAFLRTMTERGHARLTLVDAQGRPNYIEGQHKVQITRVKLSAKEEESGNPVTRILSPMQVTAIGPGDAHGPDACTTQIEGVKPPADLFDVRSSSWEEPGFMISITVLKTESWDYTASFQRLQGVQYLDWRHATVTRSNDGGEIYIQARAAAPWKAITLSFHPAHQELSDRIEYAAKFLQMSCDEAAATGF